MTQFDALQRNAPEFAAALKMVCPAADLEWQSEMFAGMFKSGDSPHECLGADFIGNGAFKEVYASIPGHVIKFIAHRHIYREEDRIMDCARSYGLPPIFVESIYGHLPVSLGADVIGEAMASDFDWDDPMFNYFCIQPRCRSCDIVGRDDLIPWITAEYKPELLPVHIPHVIIDVLDGVPYEWCANAIDCYGAQGFIRFCEFCEQYNITDLRADNIGYLEGRPVVLDWLS